MGKKILISSDCMGRGNDELGHLLMRNFLYSLARASEKPESVMFMNGGVRLVCAGSESLGDIEMLVESGVAIKACGTCLDFLGLKDYLVVGEVGAMVGAVDAFLADGEVVTIA